MIRFLLFFAVFSGVVLFSGCRSVDDRISSEDIEVPEKYSSILTVLRNSYLSTNSEEKYEAVKDLLKAVDLSYTRELKTVNALFYHGDAAIDNPNAEQRNVIFNFQYKNEYVRLIFATMRNYVLRVSIICSENSMRKYETPDADKYRVRRR